MRIEEITLTEKQIQKTFDEIISKIENEHKKEMKKKYCIWEHLDTQFSGRFTHVYCSIPWIDHTQIYNCKVPKICPYCNRPTREKWG